MEAKTLWGVTALVAAALVFPALPAQAAPPTTETAHVLIDEQGIDCPSGSIFPEESETWSTTRTFPTRVSGVSRISFQSRTVYTYFDDDWNVLLTVEQRMIGTSTFGPGPNGGQESKEGVTVISVVRDAAGAVLDRYQGRSTLVLTEEGVMTVKEAGKVMPVYAVCPLLEARA